MTGLVKSLALGLALALIAGTASAQSWVYAGRGPDWAIAVDADSVERSGSTVTIRELYVARPQAGMPRRPHDYLTASVVVDCEARTLYKHSWAFFAFDRAAPVSREQQRTAPRRVRDNHERRLLRAACTDFLEGGDTATTEEWARVLILRMRAADNWQEPLSIQDWRISRLNNYSCELRSSYDEDTALYVTLGVDGEEAFFLRARDFNDQPSTLQTPGAIGVRQNGGDWKEIFKGRVEFSAGFLRGVSGTVPGLVDALASAQDFALIAEGLPSQFLRVGPMDAAVASLKACALGSSL